MDSSLKYTEDKIVLFDIDSIFQRKMRKYPQSIIHNIVTQIVENVTELPKLDYHAQKVFGVVKIDKPIFFCIDYINENDDIPVMIDINEVEVDDYLDAINNKKYFKTNEQQL
jgi:hypothetical protein